MLPLAALKVFMVTDKVTGKVDFTKSNDKLTEALVEYEVRQGQGYDLAATAVAYVFDTFKGQRLATSFIVSKALGYLKSTPDNYKQLTDAVELYLRENLGSDGFALFGTKKGVGLWRWSDQTKSA